MPVDPVGVLALLTGLPGLVTACAEIYELTLRARRIGTDGAIILTKIGNEQAVFQVWAWRTGLMFVDDEHKPDILRNPVIGPLLVQNLESIKLILEELGKLIEKHELLEESTEGVTVNANYVLPEKFWKRHAKLADRAKKIQKTHNWSRKLLTWTAGDAERARSLVGDLHDLNANLFWAAGLGEDMAAFVQLPSQVLPQVLDTEALERLSLASSEYYPELGVCSKFKLEVLNIAEKSSQPVDVRNTYKKKPSSLVPLEALNSERRLGSFKGQDAAVETVFLEDKFYDTTQDGSHEAFVHKRVYEVARLLSITPKPSRFRVLDCLGYYPDQSRKRYSFIFRIPGDFATAPNICTLGSLMDPCNAQYIPKPALGQRFALAQSITTSLLYLQACSILHKALSSQNIILFQRNQPPAEAGTDHDLSAPFISGFDFARLHGSDFKSEPIRTGENHELLFAHPDYDFSDRQRYLKAYDVYSLGLMLVQIAMWQPLETLATGAGGRQKFRLAMLEKVGELEQEVGKVYARVVARCLTGDLECETRPTQVVSMTTDEDRLADNEWQMKFVQNVVQQLDKCYA